MEYAGSEIDIWADWVSFPFQTRRMMDSHALI